jgi:excisionase family DNA binding protein
MFPSGRILFLGTLSTTVSKGTQMQKSFEEQSAIEARLMTAREAAKYLNISERTLWTLSNGGDLPRVQIGRAVRYDAADLEAFINTNK